MNMNKAAVQHQAFIGGHLIGGLKVTFSQKL